MTGRGDHPRRSSCVERWIGQTGPFSSRPRCPLTSRSCRRTALPGHRTGRSGTAPTGSCADPVGLACRLVGSEDDVHRPVGVDDRVRQAADRRQRVVGLQFRPAERVIDHDGPEVVDRNALAGRGAGSRPLAFFAGIWTQHACVRMKSKGSLGIEQPHGARKRSGHARPVRAAPGSSAGGPRLGSSRRRHDLDAARVDTP